MSTPNPWTITLGTLEVGGGSTNYQLNGPYAIERSSERLRFTTEVVVVAADTEELSTLSQDLEAAASGRDFGFSIDMDGEVQQFVEGAQLLNPQASVSKKGDREFDQGLSRIYTLTLEAGVAAADTGGLRDLSANRLITASRRTFLTVSGTYTSTSGNSASANYLANADGEIGSILTSLGGTWELIDENYAPDRNDHNATFSRTYAELLYNQGEGLRDSPFVVDATITFNLLEQQPGDAQAGVVRLSRVVARIDCSIDNDAVLASPNEWENGDPLQDIYDTLIREHLLGEFQANFQPTAFGIENERISFDRTDSRISGEMQFILQPRGGAEIVEVAQSLAYSEQRQIDYTPVHAGTSNNGELAAYADRGALIVTRISTRTVTVVGQERPRYRLAKRSTDGSAGPLETVLSGNSVTSSGWNLLSNTSRITPQYIGLADNQQLRITTLDETVVERYTVAPTGTSSATQPLEPTTPTSQPGGPATGGEPSIPGTSGPGGVSGGQQ